MKKQPQFWFQILLLQVSTVHHLDNVYNILARTIPKQACLIEKSESPCSCQDKLAYTQVTLNYTSVTTHAIQVYNTQACSTLHSTQICSGVLRHDIYLHTHTLRHVVAS